MIVAAFVEMEALYMAATIVRNGFALSAWTVCTFHIILQKMERVGSVE